MLSPCGTRSLWKQKNYNVKICLLSVRCHSFLNVKLHLSFILPPFFPPTGKCPEPVYHIFRSPALMKELHSGRRKKETEIESSQGGFREQLLASDVTAGPTRCRPHHLCTMPMSLQHVNCVMMNNTKPEWPFMLYDMYFRRVGADDYATPASWNCNGKGSLFIQCDMEQILSHIINILITSRCNQGRYKTCVVWN